jgi:hypothetical protein
LPPPRQRHAPFEHAQKRVITRHIRCLPPDVAAAAAARATLFPRYTFDSFILTINMPFAA